MNRTDLIDTLSKSTGQTKVDSEKWLEAFIATVSKNMKKKEGVKIVGFGTFLSAKRKARTGRNPQTGEAIKIPARVVPVFRAGTALKESIAKK